MTTFKAHERILSRLALSSLPRGAVSERGIAERSVQGEDAMVPSIIVRCPSCDARIKAPLQLIGQWRACPGCGCRFVVQPQVPQEEGPVLVGEERTSPYATSGSRR